MTRVVSMAELGGQPPPAVRARSQKKMKQARPAQVRRAAARRGAPRPSGSIATTPPQAASPTPYAYAFLKGAEATSGRATPSTSARRAPSARPARCCEKEARLPSTIERAERFARGSSLDVDHGRELAIGEAPTDMFFMGDDLVAEVEAVRGTRRGASKCWATVFTFFGGDAVKLQLGAAGRSLASRWSTEPRAAQGVERGGQHPSNLRRRACGSSATRRRSAPTTVEHEREITLPRRSRQAKRPRPTSRRARVTATSGGQRARPTRETPLPDPDAQKALPSRRSASRSSGQLGTETEEACSDA